MELDQGLRRLLGPAALAVVVALSGCGGGDDEDKDRAREALSKQFAAEHRKAERAVEDGRLPKEVLQMFDKQNRIQTDFTGKPGSQDVVKQDTNGDGKPDRNLHFDLDQDGKIEPGEKRITESALFGALMRVVRPQSPQSPASDPGKDS